MVIRVPQSANLVAFRHLNLDGDIESTEVVTSEDNVTRGQHHLALLTCSRQEYG